jgi:hypothetical protein
MEDNTWFGVGDVEFVVSDGLMTAEIKSGRVFIITIFSSGVLHFMLI